MSRWFKAATELVLIRNSAELLVKLIEVTRKELALDSVYVLKASQDGRFFECCQNEKKLTWSVFDFNHPFSHVIRSDSSMTLQHSELLYWQENSEFNQLIGTIDILEKVTIIPMFAENKQLQTILVLHSGIDQMGSIETHQEFINTLSVCANHFQLLHEIEMKKCSSKQLFQSLVEVEEGNKKNHMANGLANTLIGNSDVMKKLRQQVVSAAASHLSVMIQGDTGTGKELVSRAVHDLSTHSKAEFVAINCAAIPEHLLESELFGYIKGAFSGADKDKKGLLADANGGTLFLDEIGDMPIALQAKLLRVLESQKYRPLGAEKELSSNFRLVVATHVNLKEHVSNGKFRKDLYYRIYQYPIILPKLSDRIEDVELLSRYFINNYNTEHKYTVRGLHHKALDYLMSYQFPGNVRELKHLIEYGCTQTEDGEQVIFSHIIDRLDKNLGSQGIAVLEIGIGSKIISDLKGAVKEYETNIITSRLREFDGDRAKTAESLGIPKRTLADKCLKLEIVIND
jgi:sigma-54-specific transcriptional regulator